MLQRNLTTSLTSAFRGVGSCLQLAFRRAWEACQLPHILDRLERARSLPILGLLMYGTPTSGTELVRVADLLGLSLKLKGPVVGWIASWWLQKNRQLRELSVGSELLQRLQDKWMFHVANGGHSSETDPERRASLLVRMVTGNDDWIVSEASAKGIYGEIDWHPISCGHIALAKPESKTDQRFLLAKNFFQRCRDVKESDKLARVQEFSDDVLNSRRGRMIQNWRFHAELRLRDPHPDTSN